MADRSAILDDGFRHYADSAPVHQRFHDSCLFLDKSVEKRPAVFVLTHDFEHRAINS